jgi:hypothetical protein
VKSHQAIIPPKSAATHREGRMPITPATKSPAGG